MAAGGGQGAPGGKAGSTPSSGTGGGAAGGAGAGVLGSAGSSFMATGMRLFPQNVKSPNCSYPTGTKSSDVTASYELWKSTVVVSDGAGGFRRVKKPDSGSVIGSTVSEGIGYGMVLAVYMGDQALFDDLWKYSQLHLDGQGFMNWEIAPDGSVTAGGNGGATDGDEDITWALVMADKQWGGKGTLSDTYLNLAKHMIDLIWQFEVDHTRGEMLKPGNNWGGADTTNPSYFAPAYYRVFGQVSGNTANWNKVVDSSYSIISLSLNATNGNATNGLVPAWCSSTGVPQMGLGFQNDATRTPFRVGQDYCWFGEPRAKAYLAMITNFYVGVGVDKITNGYALNGTPQPDKVYLPAGLQAASFVGPAGVGAMSDPKYQQFVDDAYAEVATLKLTAGTIYYQKSWSALSLLMMTGNLIDFTGH
jgi:endo-1,4-beta-D-glucanase Y